jgi:hypothetical protein
MPRLPSFDRALILVYPHGDYIASGAKTSLVKSRRYHMEGETLLVVQDKQALGTLRLAAPRVIGLEDFRLQRERHRVSEEERRRWWPRKTAFYSYAVEEFRPLRRPVAVAYPRGPQVFVRPATLRVDTTGQRKRRHAQRGGV